MHISGIKIGKNANLRLKESKCDKNRKVTFKNLRREF